VASGSALSAICSRSPPPCNFLHGAPIAAVSLIKANNLGISCLCCPALPIQPLASATVKAASPKVSKNSGYVSLISPHSPGLNESLCLACMCVCVCVCIVRVCVRVRACDEREKGNVKALRTHAHPATSLAHIRKSVSDSLPSPIIPGAILYSCAQLLRPL